MGSLMSEPVSSGEVAPAPQPSRQRLSDSGRVSGPCQDMKVNEDPLAAGVRSWWFMLMIFKHSEVWGWGDGSVTKSMHCSYRGPEFGSQRPHLGAHSPL